MWCSCSTIELVSHILLFNVAHIQVFILFLGCWNVAPPCFCSNPEETNTILVSQPDAARSYPLSSQCLAMIVTHLEVVFFSSLLGRSDLQPYFWPTLRPRVRGHCQVIWSERPSVGSNAGSRSVFTSVFVHTGTDLLWFLIKIKVPFSFQCIDVHENPVWGLC